MSLIRQQWFHIFLSGILALSCVLFFPNKAILYSIIAFGQVHFLLSYFYSNKSGKMDTAYLKRFFGLLALIGIACLFIDRNPQFSTWLIFITSVVFAAHYFNDEFRLSGLDTLRNQAFATLSVASSFFSIFSVKLFSLDSRFVWMTAAIAAGFAAIFLFQRFVDGDALWKRPLFLFFFLLNICLPIFFALHPTAASINQILGFIVLFHYLRWYLYYFERFEGKELGFYMDAVVWAHAFVLLAFVQYMLAPFSGIAYFFFDPVFFYGWTLMHIALTFRPRDYTFVV